MTNAVDYLRHAALSLSLALLAAFAAPTAFAASITVDPSAIDAAVAGDGKCSLREAVLSVNAGANVGDCVATVLEAYGTKDTLNLPAGVYTLTRIGVDETFVDAQPGNSAAVPTVSNVADATVGDLDLLKSVKIIGAGAGSTTITWSNDDGVTRDRLFHINAATGTVAVSMQGLTLSNGLTQESLIKVGPRSSFGLLRTLYYLRRAGGAVAVGPAAAVVLADLNKTGQLNTEGRGGSKKPGTTGADGGATLTLEMKQVTIARNLAGADGATEGSGINTIPSASNLVTLKNVLLSDNRKGYTDGMSAAVIAALPSANCGSTGSSLNVSSRGFNVSSDGSCQSVLNLAGDQA